MPIGCLWDRVPGQRSRCWKQHPPSCLGMADVGVTGYWSVVGAVAVPIILLALGPENPTHQRYYVQKHGKFKMLSRTLHIVA